MPVTSLGRLLCAVGLALLINTPIAVVHGKVVINEIMLNPLNGAQWFELHNTADASVSLREWFMQAAGPGGSVKYYFALSATIAAKGYLTIGQTNANNFVDLEWSNLFTFPKDGYGVYYDLYSLSIHSNARGLVEDSVTFNVNSAFDPKYILPFPSQPGASLRRNSATAVTQDPGNWSRSPEYIDCTRGNNKGTPGEDNTKKCSTVFTKAPIGTKAPTKAPVKAPTKAPTKGPTKAPTKGPTKAPTKGPVKIPTKAPAAPMLPELTGLDLFNADSNLKHVTLTDGMVVALPPGMTRPAWNIVATYDAAVSNHGTKVESVVFAFQGNSRYRTEAKAPFALCANDGNDIFNCGGNTLGCGTYTVTARPFSGGSGTGTAGTPVTVTFTITGCSGGTRGGK